MDVYSYVYPYGDPDPIPHTDPHVYAVWNPYTHCYLYVHSNANRHMDYHGEPCVCHPDADPHPQDAGSCAYQRKPTHADPHEDDYHNHTSFENTRAHAHAAAG